MKNLHQAITLILALMLAGSCGTARPEEETITQPAAPSPAAAEPTAPEIVPSIKPIEKDASRYDGPGDYFDRVYSRGEPRLFKLHIPPGYRPGTPMPLVLVLHGGGQEIDDMEDSTRLSEKADQAGFIVAYPQASLLHWNTQDENLGAADVVFVQILITYLERQLDIDPTRIYATGFSNGGSMVHRLACDLSGEIAAIAPISGAYSNTLGCKPERPVPVVAFHGTGDTYISYQDNNHDVPRWAAGWAGRNGCDPTSTLTWQEGDVTGETWSNCQANATVTLYTIKGGRHIWPGSPRAQQFFPDVQDVPANDLIWDFFQAHPMP